MTTLFQVHCVKAVAARSSGSGSVFWAEIDVETTSGRTQIVLFFNSESLAHAIANAINYANASASVQTHHDKRLSDAGLEEYRNLITEIA